MLDFFAWWIFGDPEIDKMHSAMSFFMCTVRHGDVDPHIAASVEFRPHILHESY